MKLNPNKHSFLIGLWVALSELWEYKYFIWTNFIKSDNISELNSYWNALLWSLRYNEAISIYIRLIQIEPWEISFYYWL